MRIYTLVRIVKFLDLKFIIVWYFKSNNNSVYSTVVYCMYNVRVLYLLEM